MSEQKEMVIILTGASRGTPIPNTIPHIFFYLLHQTYPNSTTPPPHIIHPTIRIPSSHQPTTPFLPNPILTPLFPRNRPRNSPPPPLHLPQTRPNIPHALRPRPTALPIRLGARRGTRRRHQRRQPRAESRGLGAGPLGQDRCCDSESRDVGECEESWGCECGRVEGSFWGECFWGSGVGMLNFSSFSCYLFVISCLLFCVQTFIFGSTVDTNINTNNHPRFKPPSPPSALPKAASSSPPPAPQSPHTKAGAHTALPKPCSTISP